MRLLLLEKFENRNGTSMNFTNSSYGEMLLNNRLIAIIFLLLITVGMSFGARIFILIMIIEHFLGRLIHNLTLLKGSRKRIQKLTMFNLLLSQNQAVMPVPFKY